MKNEISFNIKNMKVDDLHELSDDIRKFLIKTISETGGHIGANLSVVELTVALHYMFDSPDDPFIFDTGHQGYAHKLLTDRKELFATLNTFEGMSRFVSKAESVHDTIEASHAGTSISIASGIAHSLKAMGSDRYVISMIGDGSMVEGMAFEGLNYASTSDLKMLIVLNDNEMAIAPSVGGIRHLTTGPNWAGKSKSFFEGMGLNYLSVADGHDIDALISTIKKAKELSGPVLMHVKTEKGKGLPCAKDHPYKMHFSMPFNSADGSGASPTIAGKTFGSEAAEQLMLEMRKDPNIVAITPATPYASYLQSLAEEFPDRVIDVGMAEQHAVGMACGLALKGLKPVLCIQTTFMQRAFDQLLHDVCYMNLPVTILGVRSGFAGYDSPTHHGIYDISYLRTLPNMQVIYPYSTDDIRNELTNRLSSPDGPMIILHPYEVITEEEIILPEAENDRVIKLRVGNAGAILCLSNTYSSAIKLHEKLNSKHGKEFSLYCIKGLKPFPADVITELCKSITKVVCIEESTLPGGLGSLVAECIVDSQVSSELLRIGVPDIFVPAGNKIECSTAAGMDEESIYKKIIEFWPDI
jgi:1-deoxy-D-xylulose-5-phosphate synthase